jgi:hypothetical protein
VVALSPFSSVAPDLKVLSHAVRHQEGGGWGSVVLIRFGGGDLFSSPVFIFPTA